MSNTTFEASFSTSGTSPGNPARGVSRPRALIVGLGPVGRAALLDAAPLGLDVVAVADTSGVLYFKATDRARGAGDARRATAAASAERARAGDFDAQAVARVASHKQAGGRLRELGAEPLPLDLALALIAPEVVLVATDSDPARAESARLFVRAALREGARVALASKNALLRGDAELRDALASGRLGCAATFGGTGAALARALPRLREQCVEVELVANATSTLVLDAFARGAALDEALAEARELALLEGDPSADLDGTDAAIKLAAVSALVLGRDVDPASLARPHLARIDARDAWRAARAGRVTRLVARASATGASIELRELELGDPLAAAQGSVVYAYRLRDGRRVVHVGRALGANRTAHALLADAVRVCEPAREHASAGARAPDVVRELVAVRAAGAVHDAVAARNAIAVGDSLVARDGLAERDAVVARASATECASVNAREPATVRARSSEHELRASAIGGAA